ncbi:MAG: hypothetical protein H6714_00510 [Myxococcales bacterium]|nr:hypothetical protein [Myxococcales bacterium]
MDHQTLIDSLVRQMMVAIARLAAVGGRRTSVAHITRNIFLDLSRELKAHNLSNKIIADMFGLTLRAYHAKMKRLAEIEGERASSLWQSAFAFISSRLTVTRAEILRKFGHYDATMIQGAISDLVESGLVSRSGRGPATLYRCVAMVRDLEGTESHQSLANLVWIVIRRVGPCSREQLHELFPAISTDILGSALAQLEIDGRVRKDAEQNLYDSELCVIQSDDRLGWEAAIFDHFQAVCNVICHSAEAMSTSADRDPYAGGSTFTFDLDENHPLRDPILGLLARLRSECSELRERADAHNKHRSDRPQRPFQVRFYLGQNVTSDDQEDVFNEN